MNIIRFNSKGERRDHEYVNVDAIACIQSDGKDATGIYFVGQARVFVAHPVEKVVEAIAHATKCSYAVVGARSVQ